MDAKWKEGEDYFIRLRHVKNFDLKQEDIEHKVITLDMRAIGGSALTDDQIDVPDSPSEGIPVTYVPARNTIFLSYALAWAEVLEAQHIFIGVNAVDYSGTKKMKSKCFQQKRVCCCSPFSYPGRPTG